MDFLNALPPEVWGQIIAFSAQSPAEIANPLRHLSHFDQIDYDSIKDHQSYVAGLQTVCKLLYPFVKEYLFVEVLLKNTQSCEAFLKIAYIQAPTRKRYGEYTRSIYLNVKAPQIATINQD